ncbi:hypothetical protein T265_11282 [Opisthorchis viverrini]|uniref:Reverse transcriptase domain-containing protein n=1 Tax=Opisthorchis viverrini TaxID=6198 RepID=A0A074ZA20_OPIVI|nr:hypothetical protein T265_11282 [Opisthorchis viverrini]KER20085.1 hypothetical protein T265_11282 [Opisthorchis viverrini]
MVVFMDSLTQAKDEGLISDAIFFDFSKAFDRVPHVPLLHKLDYVGHGCTRAGILPGRPYLDRRTIGVLNQSLRLKSPTARQRFLAGKCKCITFSTEQVAVHVPTPNPEDQEILFVRPLTIDQPGTRDSVSVARTPPSIAQWVAEVHKPPHYDKVQSLLDGPLGSLALDTSTLQTTAHTSRAGLLNSSAAEQWCQIMA